MAVVPLAKPKPCKQCKGYFRPRNGFQKVCSPACATLYVRAQEERRRQRKLEKAAREEKRERLEKLKALRSHSDWLQITQAAFNAFIRERDHDESCISCGRYVVETFTGGCWDCGHFRTIGAAPELRFDEQNAHKQCKSCNSGVRRSGRRVHTALDPERAATIRAMYREGLVKRIGLAAVERLEGPNPPKHYTVAELEAMTKDFRARTREMRKARGAC